MYNIFRQKSRLFCFDTIVIYKIGCVPFNIDSALANKGNVPVHADPIDLILYDPVREADAIADALIAYLDTGAALGTITLESTFVAGEG